MLRGDLDTLEEMLAPDFVDHNTDTRPTARPRGLFGGIQPVSQAAYSHTRYVIEKQIGEGDEVVTSFSASATHDRGEVYGP